MLFPALPAVFLSLVPRAAPSRVGPDPSAVGFGADGVGGDGTKALARRIRDGAWGMEAALCLISSSAPKCLLLFWPVLNIVGYGFFHDEPILSCRYFLEPH